MKKIWILFFCVSLLLVGCKQENKDLAIKQDKIQYIGVEDTMDKIIHKDTFTLIVTRKQCPYCEALLDMIQQTIDNHNVMVYVTVMQDDTQEHLQQDSKKLEKYLDEPFLTPQYYYIKDGEVVSREKGFTKTYPDRFWYWIKENEIE